MTRGQIKDALYRVCAALYDARDLRDFDEATAASMRIWGERMRIEYSHEDISRWVGELRAEKNQDAPPIPQHVTMLREAKTHMIGLREALMGVRETTGKKPLPDVDKIIIDLDLDIEAAEAAVRLTTRIYSLPNELKKMGWTVEKSPRVHDAGCPFNIATGPAAVECEHGYDVCPKCDKCTCGAAA